MSTVATNPALTGVVVNPLSVGADVTVGQVTANDVTTVALATPSAPTITNVGTTGAATWTYKVVAKVGSGATARVTAASAGGSTATGNATLDTTNYNTITWAAVTGATSYDIYRTAHGTTPSTNGLIANVLATAPLTLNDTALSGDSSTAPTVNTTGGITGLPGTTYSPVVAFGGASVGVTYGVQVGSWKIVDGRAFVSGYVALTAKGSSVGQITISLPIASNASANNYAPANIAEPVTTGVTGIVGGYVKPNSSVITMDIQNNGNVSALADTNATNTTQFMFATHYLI